MGLRKLNPIRLVRNSLRMARSRILSPLKKRLMRYRVIDWFTSYLFGDDVFISYSRRGGVRYAEELAYKLSGDLGFSCRLDLWETLPGRRMPKKLMRSLQRSRMLVVVASKRALKSENVTREIKFYKRTHSGNVNIVPVDFNGKVLQAQWFKLIDGLPPGPREDPKTLRSALPSGGVVKRIGESVRFRKRNRRLFWASISSLLLVILLIGLGGGTGVYAAIKVTEAAAALAAAADARLDATKQRELAMNFKDEADRQSIEAGRQCHEANKQTWLAEAAESQRVIAEAQKRQADQAASRQRTIAVATEYANKSDAAFKQKPELLPQSLSYAVTSANLLESIGRHSLYTDISLRNSLGLFSKSLPPPAVSDGSSFSPDANFVAREKNGGIEVGPVGKPQEMKPTAAQGQILALSMNGNYLATATETGAYGDVTTTVLVSELKSSRTFSVTLKNKNVRIISASLSRGGKYLAMVTFKTKQEEEFYFAGVWNVENGNFITQLATPGDLAQALSYGESTVSTVAFSADDLAIAIGGKKGGRGGSDMGFVRVWDLGLALLVNDELPQKPSSGQDAVDASIFDSYLTLYEDDPVRAVAVGNAGNYLAAGSGQMTRVWKKDSRGNFQEAGRIRHEKPVEAIAFGPEPNTLSGIGNGVLYSWEATGYHELVQNPSAAELLQLKLGADNRASSTSNKSASEKEGLALTLRQIEEDNEIVANKNGGGVLMINNPRQVIFLHGAQTLRIWDKVRREETRLALGEDFWSPLRIDASLGGKHIALNGYNRDLNRYVTAVYERGPAGYSRIQRWVEQQGRPEALKLNPEGTILATPGVVLLPKTNEIRSTIILRSTKTGKQVLPGKLLPAFSNNKIVFSPSGKYIITAGPPQLNSKSNVVEIWEAATGKLRRQLVHDTAFIEDITFSSHERYLASAGSDGKVLVWDSVTNKVHLLQHDAVVGSIAFSHDERFIGTGCEDMIGRLWQLPAGVEAMRLPHDNPVTKVSFSADDKYLRTESKKLASSLADPAPKISVRIWVVRERDLVNEACQRLYNVLSPNEWQATCGTKLVTKLQSRR